MRLSPPARRASHGALLAGLLCVAVLLGAGVAAAAPALRCPVPAGAAPSLGEHSAAARLRFLRTEVGHAAHTARAWAFTWGTAYAAQAAVGLVQLPGNPSYDDKVDLGVSAASSLLGVATLLISPPAAIAAERRIGRLLTAPGQDPCARLAAAEAVLARAAASETFSRGPLIHIGTAIYNMGLGVLLGFVFQHWRAAGITSMVGLIVGTTMNITKPTGSIRTLARYRSGRLDSTPPAPFRFSLIPEAGREGAALRLGFTF